MSWVSIRLRDLDWQQHPESVCGEKIVGSKNYLPSTSCTLSLYHLVSTFIGILLTFSPMHFLGFNVMPRRMPDFPDSFHSWNFLSSIGSGITFLSFAIFILIRNEWNFLLMCILFSVRKTWMDHEFLLYFLGFFCFFISWKKWKEVWKRFLHSYVTSFLLIIL